MAPSAGSLHAILWRSIKKIRVYYAKAAQTVEAHVNASTRSAQVQPAHLHITPRHPIHQAAYLRQSKSRWYSTDTAAKASARQFGTSSAVYGPPGVKYIRSSFPKSRVGAAIGQLPGRAPFASTLRPNLTGGSLGRTAGGYALSSGRVGGARFFSHTPAAPTQVMQNVSQAVRAFLISGQKAQYDGTSPCTGEKRYKAVSALQKEVGQKMTTLPKATPGSFVDFTVNPTITALTPLGAVAGHTPSAAFCPTQTLQTDGLLDVLSVDFSRALKDLASILNDLARLAALGDLPITYHAHAPALRIHFPGCDAETVEKLCGELGVLRGVVGQDVDFDAFVGSEIALLFPFAPGRTGSECEFFDAPVEERMLANLPLRHGCDPEPGFSARSDDGLGFELEAEEIETPWVSSPSGYESLRSSEIESFGGAEERNSPLEYQGFEGIYRFVEACDGVRV